MLAAMVYCITVSNEIFSINVSEVRFELVGEKMVPFKVQQRFLCSHPRYFSVYRMNILLIGNPIPGAQGLKLRVLGVDLTQELTGVIVLTEPYILQV